MSIYRPFLEKLGGESASAYIGTFGDLFYDPSINQLKVSDGITSGGNYLSLTSGSSMLPALDNVYNLGSPTMRWKSLYLGPNSLTMVDTTTSTMATMSIANGILFVNGVSGQMLGNIQITTTGLTTAIPSQNITIGTIGDTGYLQINNVGIKFPDNSILTSAPNQALNTTSNVSFNNVLNSGLEFRTANFIPVPSTGTYSASVTQSSNVLILANASCTITWNMPASPTDGQICSWTPAGYATAFLVGSGATVSPSYSGPCISGFKFRYVYRASTSTWYAIS